MYEYMIVNEHSGERIGYEQTERKAKERVEDEAIRHGSQRISMWKRAGTYESQRVWK